jgi:hypothetical protein
MGVSLTELAREAGVDVRKLERWHGLVRMRADFRAGWPLW